MQEKKKRIVILGGSGAVGHAVVTALAQLPAVESVTALVRRPWDGLPSSRVSPQLCNVLDPASYAPQLMGHDSAVCTFGVGQPTKVSREEFKRVDFDAVLGFAKACRAADISHFSLLGSVAADPHSRSFYLKSKGELRTAIAGLGFTRVSVFQPSMLITKTNRYDWVQGLMLTTWPAVSNLLVGPLRKYRGITVERLGAAMAAHLFTPGAGVEILLWPEIMDLELG